MRKKTVKENNTYMLLCDYLRVKKYAQRMSDNEPDISLDIKLDDILFVYNNDRYYCNRLNRTYIKVEENWVRDMRRRCNKYAKMFNILREEKVTKVPTTCTIRGHKKTLLE